MCGSVRWCVVECGRARARGMTPSPEVSLGSPPCPPGCPSGGPCVPPRVPAGPPVSPAATPGGPRPPRCPRRRPGVPRVSPRSLPCPSDRVPRTSRVRARRRPSREPPSRPVPSLENAAQRHTHYTTLPACGSVRWCTRRSVW